MNIIKNTHNSCKITTTAEPFFSRKIDRVSSVHVDTATGNCKHEHVHGQNISNCLAACNCEAAHGVCAP